MSWLKWRAELYVPTDGWSKTMMGAPRSAGPPAGADLQSCGLRRLRRVRK